ncbi:hypothetical protein WJX72_005261 [[Myrmecia] bisecta]|uniref:BZIP domain-containing protein n=1 Tax=[Myrmecia] bisecta TaxID=41462 RepID=A0AAW1PPG8_9CHLO
MAPAEDVDMATPVWQRPFPPFQGQRLQPQHTPFASEDVQQCLQRRSASLPGPLKRSRAAFDVPAAVEEADDLRAVMRRAGPRIRAAHPAPSTPATAGLRDDEDDPVTKARKERRRQQNAVASQRLRIKKRLRKQELQAQIPELKAALDKLLRRIQAVEEQAPGVVRAAAAELQEMQEQLAEGMADMQLKKQELARLVSKTPRGSSSYP